MKKPVISVFAVSALAPLVIYTTISCDSKKKDVKPSAPSTNTATGSTLEPPGSSCLHLTQDDSSSWGDEKQKDGPSQEGKDNASDGDTTAAKSCSTPKPPAAPAPGPTAPESDDPAKANPSSPANPGSPSPSPPASTGTPPPATGPTSPAPAPAPAPGGGGSGATYSIGPGIDGCWAQAKVWKAVDSTQPGKSGSCGDSLVNFCCTETEIYSKFSSSKSFLEPEFTTSKNQGLVLYGCSTDASTRTTFHFAKYDGTTWSYRTLYITSKSEPGTPPSSCPKVGMGDLGYKP